MKSPAESPRGRRVNWTNVVTVLSAAILISAEVFGAAFAGGCMGHLELAELGREANVKNLVLTHITTQMDQPGVREKIIGEMAQIYKGNLFFGEDLMRIPFDGPTVPKLD